jgi:pimeloyl-ACP methyl ester carboxylesterase
MQLNLRRWGSGPKTAVLIHGLFSDSRCWYRLGPALADRGYSVFAPDLRGHGQSGQGRYGIVDWSLDVLESVPLAPDLAVGHSLGGLVLGVIAGPLAPANAVYLDPAWISSDAQSSNSLREWTEWLAWTSPDDLRRVLGQRWPEEDLRLRWESFKLTDPETVPGLARPGGYDVSPERAVVRSLIVAPKPSQYIVDPAEMVERGFEVEMIPNSGHSYFREDFDTFWGLLEGWLQAGKDSTHAGLGTE